MHPETISVSSSSLDSIRLPVRDIGHDYDPDIRDLIPNINTDGLTYAGRNSSIQRNVGLNLQTPFADILCRRIRFGTEDWPSLIKDQVVVDLCAGDRPFGYYIACVGEAKAYIGVDAYVADSLNNALSRREQLVAYLHRYTESYTAKTGRIVNLIPKLVVAEDAATFIERIKENSVSIFTIGMHSLLEDEQYERLKHSIPLALSKTGCMVEYPYSMCWRSKLDINYQEPIYIGRQTA